MKTINSFLVLLLTLTGFSAFAQDVIYMTDGTKSEGKVSLVGSNTITYKKADNLNGPDHEINKKDVLLVVYENGTHETFTTTTKNNGTTTDFGRHLFSWQFTDLLATDVTISYELYNKSGNLGLRIPVSMSFVSDGYDYGDNPEVFGSPGRIFAAGFDLNYYPTGQGKVKYFLGPSVLFSVNRTESYQYYEYLVDSIPPYEYDYVENYTHGQASRLALLMNNGLSFQPTKNFNIKTVLGLGIARYFGQLNDYSYPYYNNYNPAVTLSVSAGYRF